MLDLDGRLRGALDRSQTIVAVVDGAEVRPESAGARALVGNDPAVAEALARVVEVAEVRGDRAEIETSIIDAAGAERRLSLELVRESDGSVVVVGYDVTERYARETALAHRATTDALTGLPNRFLFADRFGQALLSADRQQTMTAVIVLDLDRFKDVNDSFGHQVGDVVLREVAQRVRRVLRDSDTVARLGGDEFAIVLPPPTDALGALASARKVAVALAQPLAAAEERLRLTGSLGIALFPEHGRTADVLLDRADAAMYAAKRSRTTVALYDSEHDMRNARVIAELAEIGRAIDAGRLDLQYQPTVRLADRRPLRAEALVRLVDASRGTLRPAAFLPLAERGGLTPALSAWVLRHALERCRDWRRLGVDAGVSINITLRDVLDTTLPDRVRHELETAGVPASALTLEVSERGLGDEIGRLERPLKELAATGVRIALDDFGSGETSLTELQRLPLSEVKLDSRFVSAMLTDAKSWRFVRSGIDAAHDLGLEVTGKGVEDDATAYVLQRLGCDVAQGHYFTAPERASFEFLTRSELDAPPLN